MCVPGEEGGFAALVRFGHPHVRSSERSTPVCPRARDESATGLDEVRRTAALPRGPHAIDVAVPSGATFTSPPKRSTKRRHALQVVLAPIRAEPVEERVEEAGGVRGEEARAAGGHLPSGRGWASRKAGYCSSSTSVAPETS